MAEGTNVGSIFLDLVVRDTVDKQVQNIASKAQTTAQQAFSGVEKAAEKMVGNVKVQTGKAVQKTSQAVAQAGAPIAFAFNKPVAVAQAKLNQLEREASDLSQKLEEAMHKDYSFKIYGYVADDNKLVSSLQTQLDKVHSKIEAAQERLFIEEEAAAQKEAMAAQKAAQQTAAAQEGEAKKNEAAQQTAAQSAAKAYEQSASRIKNAFSKAFSGAKKMASGFGNAISGIKNKFSTASRSASQFGTRLKSIISSALVFNLLSSTLREMTDYLGTAVSSSSDMNDALANLKGAAANAASPIIQVLTPALSALANTAATVFSYVSKLMTLLTGKISNAASTATKSASSTASAAKKAAASLAGFDEIQKLNSNDSSDDSGSDTVEPNYNFEGKSNFLDSVLAAIEAGQWGQVGALIAQKLNSSLAGIQWPDIREKVREWTQNLVDTINGFVSDLDWGLIGSSLGNGLNTILLAVDTFFQGTDWKDLGSGLGTGLNDLIETLDWENLGRILTDKFKAVMELLSGFVEEFEFEDLGSNLSDMLMASVRNVNWGEVGKTLSDGAKGLLTAITTFLEETNWQEIGDDIEEFLSNIDWSGIASSLFEGIGAALGGIGALIWSVIEDEWNSFMDDWTKYTEMCGGDAISGLLVGILNGLANIGKWIWDNVFVPIWDGICSAFDIHSPSKKMAEIGINLIAGLLQGIEDTWSEIVKFFTDAFAPVQEAIEAIWEDGIGKTIKDAINGIIGSINGMISGIVSGINSVIKALNKLSFDIPEWVPAFGGQKFGFNIQTVKAPQIPYLADGGVITQPTLAMMGEYAGASNNPEIAAPQSILEETIANVMGDLAESNLAGFEAVVRAIQEKETAIEIDGNILAKTVDDYHRKMAVARGGCYW